LVKYRVKAEDANIEADLVWKDFTFVPTNVRLNPNLHTDFPSQLQTVNFLSSSIQNGVASAVTSHVPAMVSSLVCNELNPRILSLKQRLTAIDWLNLTNFDEQWTVRNNFLRFSLKSKR
ncbi:hypothetical protein OESDEN_17308, partial [Oesophagostomum dentatum]